MKNVLDMSREEFLVELNNRTTPTTLFEYAPEVYEFMTRLFGQNCNDSTLREWAFQWWAERTGKDYNMIYERWLG